MLKMGASVWVEPWVDLTVSRHPQMADPDRHRISSVSRFRQVLKMKGFGHHHLDGRFIRITTPGHRGFHLARGIFDHRDAMVGPDQVHRPDHLDRPDPRIALFINKDPFDR